MKPIYRFVLAVLVLGGCGAGDDARDSGGLSAFVTIAPLEFFVERIGGDRVDVRVLVAPGQSPATYEPTAKQMAALAHSGLFFTVGVPIEKNLVPRIRAAFDGVNICNTADGIELIDSGPEHADHGGPDPHVWLSPRLAGRLADNIYRCLAGIDPDDDAFYRTNLESLHNELLELDRELSGILAPYRGRDMVVFHPAFGYFARTYGLNQVAIEHEGLTPGTRQLADLIDSYRARGVGAVFIQPQFSSSVARNVSGEIGAELVVLDPLSKDYISNMRHIAVTVRSALENSN